MADILGIMDKSNEDIRALLGRRIRTLRNIKGWTQQELGNQADINYKFLGEIERGLQNPSFNILVKIANALEVELPEFFRLNFYQVREGLPKVDMPVLMVILISIF